MGESNDSSIFRRYEPAGRVIFVHEPAPYPIGVLRTDRHIVEAAIA